MKQRYDSITAIKAVSCFLVFTTHWWGTFYGWGSGKLNQLLSWGPFRLLTYGSMMVCIFVMLSSTLTALKVYRGKPYSWAEEMGKRYLRLAVPIFATSLAVYLLLRFGLFQNQQAALLLENDWLAMYYAQPQSVKNLFITSFVTSIVNGDSSFYGPLWMMKYIFFGTVFSIVLAEAMKGMNRAGKAVTVAVIFAMFLVVNSYYLCCLLGNVTALMILEMEKRLEATKNKKRMWVILSAAVFCFGVYLSLRSFVIAAFLQAHGIGMALGDAVFWITISGAVMVWGILPFWSLCLERGKPLWKRALLWVGDRSFSVFLVHWLVITTFSCRFYTSFHESPAWLSVGVNFLATTAVMFLCTEIFYVVFEQKAFQIVWGAARKYLYGKNIFTK